MRDSLGNIPEPQWHACLEVMVHCDGGRELGHAWSVGHPDYTREETDKYLARLTQFGPTTCRRFAELNPSGCQGCAHWGKISSPVQLGRETKSEVADASDNVLGLFEPPGFKWHGNNLMVSARDANGNQVWRVVYCNPLRVLGFLKSESISERTIVVEHSLPKDGWQRDTIEMSTIDAKTVAGKFLKIGVNVMAREVIPFMRFIQASIKNIQDTRKTEISYEQFGWKVEDGSFLVGSDLYTPAGPKVLVSVSPECQQRAAMMKPRGTMRDWVIAANQLFQPGFEGQAFALLCGFAAPLMRLMRTAGGCIVHQVGQTGSGKTMGLRGAWTVWGDQHATDVNRQDTMNARYREIAVLANLPVIFDELRNRDPQWTKDFVLSFTDGREKNRLNRTGQLVNLRHGWSTIILSAANDSLTQAVMTDNEHAHAARILEYPSTLPRGFDQAMGSKLERIFEANRGHAGREFIAGLVQPHVANWARDATQKYETEYLSIIGTGVEHRFYASLIAAVRAAGELLAKWGMLEFTPQRYVDFGLEMALVNRSGILNAMPNYPYMLQKFINSHWRNALVFKIEGGEPVLKPMADRLVMRIEQEPDKRVYIDRSYLREWATKNHVIFHDMEEMLLRDEVLIDRHFGYNLGAGTPWSGGGFIPTWRINGGHRAIARMELIKRAENKGPVIYGDELDRDARERM